MAQINPGQYGEQTESRYGHGSAAAEGAGEQRNDDAAIGNSGDGDHVLGREAPTSQVGYGGCGGDYDGTMKERIQGQSAEKNAEFGTGRSYEGGVNEQHRDGSRYDTVGPETISSKAGFGNSGPGYYQEGEQLPSHGGLPPPTRPEGAVLLSESQFPGPKYGSEINPQTASGNGGAPSPASGNGRQDLEDSEVRNGVRHGALSENAASGAGVSNDAISPMDKVDQGEFHQTGAPLPHKDSPYSQQFTEPNENAVGRTDQAPLDEGMIGNTEGGTVVDHQEKKGLPAKVKDVLPGHKHDETGTEDIPEDNPGAAPEEMDSEKPGLVAKLKNKIMPSHHKHKDELDPKIYG